MMSTSSYYYSGLNPDSGHIYISIYATSWTLIVNQFCLVNDRMEYRRVTLSFMSFCKAAYVSQRSTMITVIEK